MTSLSLTPAHIWRRVSKKYIELKKSLHYAQVHFIHIKAVKAFELQLVSTPHHHTQNKPDQERRSQALSCLGRLEAAWQKLLHLLCSSLWEMAAFIETEFQWYVLYGEP